MRGRILGETTTIIRTSLHTSNLCLGEHLASSHTHSVVCVVNGFHNVSRWMTWLPISLKNAAKCDKWYQLQNHPITESLNAKGAREKLFTSEPRACRNPQCRTKNKCSKRVLDSSGSIAGNGVLFGGQVVARSDHSTVSRHKWATTVTQYID